MQLPIPTLRNNVFLAPFLEHQIYLTSGINYINTDTEYLDKFCKTRAGTMICKQTQYMIEAQNTTANPRL